MFSLITITDEPWHGNW